MRRMVVSLLSSVSNTCAPASTTPANLGVMLLSMCGRTLTAIDQVMNVKCKYVLNQIILDCLGLESLNELQITLI